MSQYQPDPQTAPIPPADAGQFWLRIVQEPSEGRTLPKNQRMKGHTWPLDPPPVLELHSRDINSNAWFYIHNPNWFCLAELVCLGANDSPQRYKKEEDKEVEIGVPGSWSSSLHKVRGSPDPQDKREHGYFVFGDINVKITGRYRMKFSLFEMRRHQMHMYAHKLHHTMSQEFMVRSNKGESVASTPFSRLLSEAGIKIKLRAAISQKRKTSKIDWSSKKSDSMNRQLQLAPQQDMFLGPPIASPPHESSRSRGFPGLDIMNRVHVTHNPLSEMGSTPTTSMPTMVQTIPMNENTNSGMNRHGQQLPSPPQHHDLQGWAASIPTQMPAQMPILQSNYNHYTREGEQIHIPPTTGLPQEHQPLPMRLLQHNIPEAIVYNNEQHIWYNQQQSMQHLANLQQHRQQQQQQMQDLQHQHQHQQHSQQHMQEQGQHPYLQQQQHHQDQHRHQPLFQNWQNQAPY